MMISVTPPRRTMWGPWPALYATHDRTPGADWTKVQYPPSPRRC